MSWDDLFDGKVTCTFYTHQRRNFSKQFVVIGCRGREVWQGAYFQKRGQALLYASELYKGLKSYEE